MKNRKFIIFGKGYLASNIYFLNNKKFQHIETFNDIKKIKLDSKINYIIYYFAIRKSKSINYNLNLYKNLTKYFHNTNYKIIYFSTTEQNKNNYSNIHKEIEKNIDKTKNLIMRVCQIYGGDISGSNVYGVNGFINQIRSKKFLTINSDYQNRRKYLSIFKLNEVIRNKNLLSRNGIIYMASKKDFSFLELLKIINKFSRNKIDVFIKTIEKQKKPKKILYENRFKKILFNENFEKNIKKLL